MTVGPDKQFECRTVHYCTVRHRSKVHTRHLGSSRVENLICLAIGNKTGEDHSRQLFMKIRTSKACDARKTYLQDIRARAETSKVLLLMERIAAVAVDPNPIVDQRTYEYEGGCGFLLSWYKDHISNNNWLVNIVNHSR